MSENRSQMVLIGEHENVIAELKKRGFRCITLKNNNDIDYSVRNHADMAAFLLGEETVLLDKRQTGAAKELQNSGYKVIFAKKSICGAYPDDVSLNAVKSGDTLICNQRYIAREIIGCAGDIINVRQGYTKCSVCVVSDNAFITDDVGIYEKCKDKFDILLIEKGDIYLENQSYGFIGGASGKIGDKIYFFGSIENHRDSEKIKKFLAEHHVCFECLFDGNLIDIGGFIAL